MSRHHVRRSGVSQAEDAATPLLESIPLLDLLRRVVSPRIADYHLLKIKVSTSPARVHRVQLVYPNGRPDIGSVILKTVAPEWPGEPYGSDREVLFYTRVRPQLDFQHPQVYEAGIDPETQYRFLLLEDLSADYVFYPPSHTWTEAEIQCALRTYARLHVQGQNALPPEAERYWMWTYHRPAWDAESILKMAAFMAEQEIWQPLPGLERLVERTLDERPHLARRDITLVHHDVFPPNLALPADLDGEAVVIDWEMAGWGMAEIDLAYLFTQPFCSSHNINRRQALDYYWAQRQSLEGTRFTAEERQARQHHADSLLALSLLNVAYKMAIEPYPPGSFPRAYWDSMFSVLHRRLQELCL